MGRCAKQARSCASVSQYCNRFWTCANRKKKLKHESIRGALLALQGPENFSCEWCMSEIFCRNPTPRSNAGQERTTRLRKLGGRNDGNAALAEMEQEDLHRGDEHDVVELNDVTRALNLLNTVTQHTTASIANPEASSCRAWLPREAQDPPPAANTPAGWMEPASAGASDPTAQFRRPQVSSLDCPVHIVPLAVCWHSSLSIAVGFRIKLGVRSCWAWPTWQGRLLGMRDLETGRWRHYGRCRTWTAAAACSEQ